MNIPYYYNSGYDSDGVEIYTCLKCGGKISVRSWYEPNFCMACGVKYEGKKENIGNQAKVWYFVCFTERYYWSIEEKTVEIWGDPAIDQHWTEKRYYLHDNGQTPQRILAEKRKFEEGDAVGIKRAIADHERVQNLRRKKDPNFDEEKEKNSKAWTSKKEFRIVRKKEIRRHSCMIRKDIYLEKTGKEFKEFKQYNISLPCGAKEEITTGIKFIGTGKINV
jgi:hypothetical protein